MRSPGLFASFALILCLQLGSVLSQQQDIIAKWTNPTILTDYDGKCCVPEALTIQKDGSTKWTATLEFNGMFAQNKDMKCFSLLYMTTELDLSEVPGKSVYWAPFSSRAVVKSGAFLFQMIDSKLNVQYSQDAGLSVGRTDCSYTYATSSPVVKVFFTKTNCFIIIVIILVACVIVRKKINDKKAKNLAQKIDDVSEIADPLAPAPVPVPAAVQNTQNAAYIQNPGYVAPVMMYNQAYPQYYAMPQAMMPVQPQVYLQPQVMIQPQPQVQPQPQTQTQAEAKGNQKPNPVQEPPKSEISTTRNDEPKNYQF